MILTLRLDVGVYSGLLPFEVQNRLCRFLPSGQRIFNYPDYSTRSGALGSPEAVITGF
jgi:hypothetical protein